MDITCVACGHVWTGLTWCHCSGCHNTFSGVTAFDTHRVRSKCQDPASRGLVDHGRVWRFPAPKPWSLLK